MNQKYLQKPVQNAEDDLSNRPSVRVADKNPQTPETAALPQNKGQDSYASPHNHSIASGRGTPKKSRVSAARLLELEKCLCERDYHMLAALEKFNFLLTGQLQRLYFVTDTSPPANARATRRAMKRLHDYGLVDNLARRVGGISSGSDSLVWRLTEAGHRLLHLRDEDGTPRRRFREPSANHLQHTLAVSEAAAIIHTVCRDTEGLEQTALETEPDCWRSFHWGGKAVTLKPDLYAATSSDEYEDQFFIEVDRGTESPSRVVAKAKLYAAYHATGQEQQRTGAFPLCLWITSTDVRRDSLRRALRENLKASPRLFAAITDRQLEGLIRDGPSEAELC